MKRFNLTAAYAVVMMMLVAGCAGLGIPTAKTFNQRAAAAYISLDTAVQTTTVLVNRDVMSANDAQNVRNTLTDLRRGFEVAEQLYAISPADGEDKLLTTLKALQLVESYLVKVQK